MTPGAAGPLTAWTPGWLREGSTHHRQFTCRNKRKIMRIFSVPPTAETLSEPSFYDTISKIRLRQQLEMYSISRKYDYQQPQNQADSVQLSLE
ncbi:small integral membrane protein 19 isoform X3 [Prionailurus bengalensis]|uniref:small integral membrane protein 19 isoform X2 n=2 Tax=Felinae TaxID=338152 RepID=UPI0009483DD4|nr:small integral membrane protein 19 isoform X2 [Felis catus]XP_040303700.1 small integral membrane protein 19 isoform X3 [Puma yagouaroundi]XP_043418960.1 small integral membrane protein 19 isoform X3 [Prionailurus bengalensis]